MHPLAWRRLVAHLIFDWTDDPVIAIWTLWWIRPGDSVGRSVAALAWVSWIAWQLGGQATTGQTVGKRITGIRVVDVGSRAPLGPSRTLVRWLLHGLDTVTIVGWIAAVLTNRSIADRFTRSAVVSDQHRAERWSAAPLREPRLTSASSGRRGRDSNPRDPGARRFSRPFHSSALAPLQGGRG